MTYNDKTGERLVYRAKMTWWVFTYPVILMLLGFGVGSDAGAYLCVIALVWGILKLIEYLTTELYIGEKFVVAKYGLIKRDTIEILNSKVESIKVNQGVIGRILNFGHIEIVGTGGTRNPIKYISSPLNFRNAWMNLQ